MAGPSDNPDIGNRGVRTKQVEVPVLTWRAVIFAIALAFVVGYIIRATGFLWTWPLSGCVVLAAWWVYGQKITYNIPEDPED